MNEIFKKLNYKQQPRLCVFDAPASFLPTLEEMRPLAEISTQAKKSKSESFALAFVQKQKDLDRFADWCAASTASDAVVWVAYPKGTSKKYTCEFNRDQGWERFGEHGFEPVRQVAIDEDWSALRLRRVQHIKTMTRRGAISQAGQARIQR